MSSAQALACPTLAQRTTGKVSVPPVGDEIAKATGPAGGDGDLCKGIDPSGNGGKECEGIDASGGGGEESKSVGPSDTDWRRPFDMTARFLTIPGTTTSSRASYISRSRGMENTRLKMDKKDLSNNLILMDLWLWGLQPPILCRMFKTLVSVQLSKQSGGTKKSRAKNWEKLWSSRHLKRKGTHYPVPSNFKVSKNR